MLTQILSLQKQDGYVVFIQLVKRFIALGANVDLFELVAILKVSF